MKYYSSHELLSDLADLEQRTILLMKDLADLEQSTILWMKILTDAGFDEEAVLATEGVTGEVMRPPRLGAAP